MTGIASVKTHSTPCSFAMCTRVLADILMHGTLLLACITSALAQSTDDLFVHYELLTDSSARQSVVEGFFLESTSAEIIVLSKGEDGNPRAKMYGLGDSAWTLLRDDSLNSRVQFVDVVRLGGRDRLLSYEPGLLQWFNPETATQHELLAVTSSFQPPRKDEIPHVDITQDLNGDDRDDLVIPDADGFWVSIQGSDGAFTAPVKLGPPAELRSIYGADGYRYRPWDQSRIHELDYNHDGRRDLVFWNGDRFEVHLQDQDGMFPPVPNLDFTTAIAFDSDEPSALTTGDMTGRVLHSLADMNGDGIGDLVINSLGGLRLSEKRSSYEVHFGERAPDNGTAFPPQPGMSFHSEGSILLGMDLIDLAGDGQTGLMLTSIERRFLDYSLWKHIKGLMGDDIWLQLEFYQSRSGLYTDQPDAIHRIAFDGTPSHRERGSVPLDVVLRGGMHEGRRSQEIYPRSFNRTLLIGDVTGDGRSDLLIEWTHEQLRLFTGLADPELFTPRSQPLSIALPNDGEYVWLVDLNRDGKQDILLHHPFTQKDPHGTPTQAAGTELHRVTTLIAR